MLEKALNNAGIVQAIFINKKKGEPRELVQEGVFKENFGLIGDIKSGSSEKQVALLGVESCEQLNKYNNGLCTNKFHETIRVKNIELYKLPIGAKLKIGDTIQQITVIGKRCFSDCDLYKNDIRCSLSTQVVFTKIIQGGVIKVGDLIQSYSLS